MLEAVQPEARARTRSHPLKLTWGIVDTILGIIMLPFAIWMIVIEGLVNGAAWLLNQASRQHMARSDAQKA
jgi:hypothetical protein